MRALGNGHLASALFAPRPRNPFQNVRDDDFYQNSPLLLFFCRKFFRNESSVVVIGRGWLCEVLLRRRKSPATLRRRVPRPPRTHRNEEKPKTVRKIIRKRHRNDIHSNCEHVWKGSCAVLENKICIYYWQQTVYSVYLTTSELCAFDIYSWKV